MYLWPKTLEVPILDPTKYVSSNSNLPFSYLAYIDLSPWIYIRAMKQPVGILHVKVLRAMKLKKKDVMGASDPYVKVKLTEDKLPLKKTIVKHKNLNPEWNQDFNMVVKDPQSQAIKFTVFDWEQVIFLFTS